MATEVEWHGVRAAPLPAESRGKHHALTLLLLLGLSHALSDGAAGYLLGSVAHAQPTADVALLVLLYNGLAFAGQPFVGAVVDALRQPRAALVASVALMLAAVALRGVPPLSIVCAGLASALLHVGGGAIAIRATPGRATGPGLFAAPGVVGLAVGGALAVAQVNATVLFVAVLALLAVALLAAPMPSPDLPAHKEDEPLLEDHDLIMILLLGAIALRSALWSAFEWAMAGEVRLLLAAALAAGAGKLLGGYLADRVGWRRWIMGAMGGAALLLTMGRNTVASFLLGIALLQSATPIAIAAVARTMPQRPATAAGLSFGLGIAIGGFIVMGGASPWLLRGPLTMLLIVAIALAMLWALQRHRGSGAPQSLDGR